MKTEANSSPTTRLTNGATSRMPIYFAALFCLAHVSINAFAQKIPHVTDPSGFSPVGALTPTLGNYADTSLPLSTDTKITPDAAPTSATSINVSTSTNFKGKLEGNPATGLLRVTDAHPAGEYTVTVKAFDDGGASVTKTFTLTVTTPPTCNPVSFAATANFAAGSAPQSIAVGDFNGDGKQDLAVGNASSRNVSILLGDGVGNFSAPTNFATDGVYSVAVGDFNGDGKQDLAVATGSGNVYILFGDGAGNFSTHTSFSGGDFPYSIAVGDFNGDGKQDIAVVDRGTVNPGGGSCSVMARAISASPPTSSLA